jgi:hypothetical protein
MLVVEVIPYHSFKHRLQLVKKYIGKAKIVVYDTYIYVERIEGEKR